MHFDFTAFLVSAQAKVVLTALNRHFERFSHSRFKGIKKRAATPALF
jgi:hypothetical protein